jgi:hypothetical protein
VSHSDKAHTAELSHKNDLYLIYDYNKQIKSHMVATTFPNPLPIPETMSSPTPTTPTIKEIAPLQFILNVTMTIKKSDTAAFLAITQETNNLALAEPSCVFFNFGRREPINDLTFETLEGGDGDEVVFWWSEGWKCDLKWFREVQFRKEYYGPHMKAVEPMWVKPGEFPGFAVFFSSCFWFARMKRRELTELAIF